MSEPRFAIAPAQGPADLAAVRALFQEYAEWLAVDLCFQGFEAELASLPGCYAPPEGGLWLGRVAGALAGTVGLRPLAEGACEMKRLWVRPAYRGFGLGVALAEQAIAAARAAGYAVMRLDTLGHMAAARALYARLGFRETEPYYHNPLDDVRYLELALRHEAARIG